MPELLRISKLAGMSDDDFKACLSNQDLLTKMIEGRNLAVRKFKVQATPTVSPERQEPIAVRKLGEIGGHTQRTPYWHSIARIECQIEQRVL